jgi:iron complex outermembrane recepter protein
MRGGVGVTDRAMSRLDAISKRLLSAASVVALMAPVATVAQDVDLPEVKVIATTPISAPTPRPAPRSSEPTRTAAPRVAAPSAPAARPSPAPAAPVPPDPSLIDRDKVPSNVQTLSAPDFETEKAPNLLDAMSRGLPGVTLTDQTGNEFQRSVDYRGFVASPVVGTPQGLAVYQNGVRVNEVFGDVVNWDFIPEKAIRSLTLMPSNPVFGLNAIGGAISIDMKNGFNYKGVEVEAMAGSYGRRQASVQAGGQQGNLSGYVLAEAIHDSGWRNFSPSELRRVYADFGALGERTEFHINFTGASNNFGAAAATPIQMLQQNWASTYTLPQTTQNQLAFLTASGSWRPTDTLSFQGNVYYRGFWQRHVDGNATDAVNDPALCPDPAFLCFPDLNGTLSNLIGLNGQPVPNAGVLANSVLGQIDRTSTATNSFGGTLQGATSEKIFGLNNRLVIGASLDNGRVNFMSNSELGTINADQFPFVNGTGVIINQPAGDVAPVGLNAKTLYAGVYMTDTIDLTSRLSLTFGGRYNDASIGLLDTIGNNPDLTSYHNYNRINPVIGATYKLSPNVTFYAGYSEANRAPTPLELGCSDPLHPCLIDSSLVSDPTLKQVVSHTYEAGFRARFELANKGVLTWNIGVYHATNVNDIIAVASPLIGHQFFQNGGNTLRKGFEAGIALKWERWNVYSNFTWVDATFLNPLTLSSPFNPFADANGNIFVRPGDYIPGIPNYRFKAGGEYKVTDAWTIGGDINAIGSQWLVGDQSNLNPKVPAYWVVNLNTTYKVTKTVEVFGSVRNLFNQRYFTLGTFFDTGSFPYLNQTDPRTFTPGMPQAFYVGVRGKLP